LLKVLEIEKKNNGENNIEHANILQNISNNLKE
jgi:hypothetical protein